MSDVFLANNAYSSELSQSMSNELRSVVLRHSNTSLSLISSICPEIHCSRPCKNSSRTEGPLGNVSRVLCQCLEGTTLSHLFLRSSTKRWRRIRRICPRCPQLLDHHLSHSDLFLLSFSVSLQGRLASNPEILSMNCRYCCCVRLKVAMVVTTTLPHAVFKDLCAPLPL